MVVRRWALSVCAAALLCACASGRDAPGRGPELARLCAGVPDAERERGPFAHPERIERVEPLLARVLAKGAATVTTGAVVYLRAEPALTVQWLQRTLDCHLAQHAAGVEMHVAATANGFAVELRSTTGAGEALLAHSREQAVAR